MSTLSARKLEGGHGLRKPCSQQALSRAVGHTIMAAGTAGPVLLLLLPDVRGLLLLGTVRGQVVQAHAGACRRLSDCCRSDSSVSPQLILRPREDCSAESWRVDGRRAGPPVAQQRLGLVGALAPEAELLQDRLGAREEPRKLPRREQVAVPM